MRATTILAGIVIATGAILFPTAAIADGPATRPRRTCPYVPRITDAAVDRIGGAARGCQQEEGLYVSVLAPAKGGLTVSEQPTLFWYESRTTTKKYPVKITINDPAGAATLLELTLPEPQKAGIQRLDLKGLEDSQHRQVRLEPGHRYEWVVAVQVHKLTERSANPSAVASITRVPPPAGLQEALAGKDKFDQAQAYGRSGLWYDELAALESAIEQDPNDAEMRSARAELLQSQGFAETSNGTIAEATPAEQSGGGK